MHDADERRLLEGFRAREVPDEAARDRMLARLLKARRSERTVGSRTGLAIALACAIAGLVLLLMRTAALLLDTTPRPKEQSIDMREPDAPAPIEARAAVAEPPPLPTSAPSEVDAPTSAPVVEPTVRRAPRREAPPVEPSSTASITLEAALLRDAQAQLRAGAHARAQASLDEHRTRFPDGQMRDEREAIAMLVACAADSATEVRERARKLLAGPHVAAYAARIRSACGL